jgi:hypothetical protein
MDFEYVCLSRKTDTLTSNLRFSFREIINHLLRLVGVEMSLALSIESRRILLGIMLIIVNLHSQSNDMNITGLTAAPNLNNS